MCNPLAGYENGSQPQGTSRFGFVYGFLLGEGAIVCHDTMTVAGIIDYSSTLWELVTTPTNVVESNEDGVHEYHRFLPGLEVWTHVTGKKEGKTVVMNDEVASLHALLHFLNRYRLRITIMICYLFFIN